MVPSRAQVLLAFVATTMASAVFLARAEGVFLQTVFVLGIVVAFSLAVVNAATDGGVVGSVTLVLVVGVGYVAAMKWYDTHSYRLPPTPDSAYLFVALGVVVIGLLGYAVGRLVRDRPFRTSISG